MQEAIQSGDLVRTLACNTSRTRKLAFHVSSFGVGISISSTRYSECKHVSILMLECGDWMNQRVVPCFVANGLSRDSEAQYMQEAIKSGNLVRTLACNTPRTRNLALNQRVVPCFVANGLSRDSEAQYMQEAIKSGNPVLMGMAARYYENRTQRDTIEDVGEEQDFVNTRDEAYAKLLDVAVRVLLVSGKDDFVCLQRNSSSITPLPRILNTQHTRVLHWRFQNRTNATPSRTSARSKTM